MRHFSFAFDVFIRLVLEKLMIADDVQREFVLAERTHAYFSYLLVGCCFCRVRGCSWLFVGAHSCSWLFLAVGWCVRVHFVSLIELC